MKTNNSDQVEEKAKDGTENSVGSTVGVKVQKRKSVRNLGIALILLSGLFFFTMLSVPFWTLSTTQKTIVGGILFVSVQVSWWLGAALVGPAAVASMYGWFRRSKKA